MGKPNNRPEFDERVRLMQLRIAQWQADLPESKRDEWLRFLHTQYSTQFGRDNDRIWSTGQLFIPLSIAGVTALKDATLWSIIPLAIGSVALIYFWLVIAENHRAFQNSAEAMVRAIELHSGLRVEGGKLDAHPRIKAQPVQEARRQIVFLVVMLWILIVMLYVGRAIVRVVLETTADPAHYSFRKLLKLLLDS